MALSRSRCALGVVLVVVASWVPGIGAQSLPDLISSLPAARAITKRAVPARRARKARVNLAALDAPALRLQLFDDIVHRVVRTKVDRLDSRRFVWHGKDENDGVVTLAVVNNVVAGAIYTDGRAFELTVDADGTTKSRPAPAASDRRPATRRAPITPTRLVRASAAQGLWPTVRRGST